MLADLRAAIEVADSSTTSARGAADRCRASEAASTPGGSRPRAYDPLDVDRLVATADEQLGAAVEVAELAERHATSAVVRGLAALVPRRFHRLYQLGAFAPPQVLALPFAGLILHWPAIEPVVFGAIAKRLGELGDARVLPLLDGNLYAEPGFPHLRHVWIPQGELAEPSLDALRALPIVAGYAGPLP